MDLNYQLPADHNISAGEKGEDSGKISPSKQTATISVMPKDDETVVVIQDEGGRGSSFGTDVAPNEQTEFVRVANNEMSLVVLLEGDRSISSGADDAQKEHETRDETASVRVVVNRGASRTVTLQRDPPILDTHVSPNEQAAPVREQQGGKSTGTTTRDQATDTVQVVMSSDLSEVVIRLRAPPNTGTSSATNSALVTVPTSTASPAPPARPQCGICKKSGSQMTNRSKTPCGHQYCYACIREWIDKSPSAVRCFTCRHPIASFVHTIDRVYQIYPRSADGKRKKPFLPGQKPRRTRASRPRRRHHNGGGGAQQK